MSKQVPSSVLTGKNRVRPQFSVIPARQVQKCLWENLDEIFEVVRNAYIAHALGNTVNPSSLFLTFPTQPEDRIIALPASIGNGVERITGLKWVSSFPANIASGIPRASAIIVLNDMETGFPYACIEGAAISAVRTAISAVLAAEALSLGGSQTLSFGVVGTGFIARTIAETFLRRGWKIENLHLYDLNPQYADHFAQRLSTHVRGRTVIHKDPESVVKCSQMILFATTSSTPYFSEREALRHRPLVLHISLRDLHPTVILESHNVVDDVDHALKRNTSLHLTEQQARNRSFMDSTLPEILAGGARPDDTKPIVFSPFGMGILDVAVAHFICRQVELAQELNLIDEFFGNDV